MQAEAYLSSDMAILSLAKVQSEEKNTNTYKKA